MPDLAIEFLGGPCDGATHPLLQREVVARLYADSRTVYWYKLCSDEGGYVFRFMGVREAVAA